MKNQTNVLRLKLQNLFLKKGIYVCYRSLLYIFMATQCSYAQTHTQRNPSIPPQETLTVQALDNTRPKHPKLSILNHQRPQPKNFDEKSDKILSEKRDGKDHRPENGKELNRFLVERAETEEERKIGLMGRKRLVSKYDIYLPNITENQALSDDKPRNVFAPVVPINHHNPPHIDGMWFVFPQDNKTCFWMHRTYIPLDLVFVDAEGIIVGVEKHLRPYDRKPRCPKAPFRYALELKAGDLQKFDLRLGDRLRLDLEKGTTFN